MTRRIVIPDGRYDLDYVARILAGYDIPFHVEAVDTPGTTTGRDHPDTSRSAAALAFPRTGTVRKRVYEEIDKATRLPWFGGSQTPYFGMTDVQIAEVLGIGLNTVRPRRGELVAGRWVRDSGKTFRHSGRDHILWVVTPRLPETGSRDLPTVPAEAAQAPTGAPSDAVIGKW
jgi:hypothetical protein